MLWQLWQTFSRVWQRLELSNLPKCQRRKSWIYIEQPPFVNYPRPYWKSAGEHRRVHISVKMRFNPEHSSKTRKQLITRKLESFRLLHVTHVQLNDPEKWDEEQIERHEKTEGATDVGDGSALCGWHEQVRRREGQRRRVGSIQGGNGGEATPELPVLSTWHSCDNTGNFSWGKADAFGRYNCGGDWFRK